MIGIGLVKIYQLAFMCVRQHDVIVFVIDYFSGVIFKVSYVIYWVIDVEYLVIIYEVICYLWYFFDFLTSFLILSVSRFNK
jgi:hypothetical protein